ncbi:DNA topology modulation protein (plasmid) [Paraclostridium ghonii]|uniref:DNA topology modulation protein n=1 Tax=Paraclostridium ghonii TaxID=29358 RepID=UPI00202CD410|nr:DNA topology modulation protein [Paeniclostridium ghonii]MCM0165683.1 DNA topology modulation protein [Paeniclostridium ghonii]
MKIAIIGYSGSGKSTLAKKLSKHYKIPVLFLDTVNFSPNWDERDRNEGRLIVSDFMENESWVIDGNYSGFFQQERLNQADKIIFLNFPRRICAYRAVKRYFKYKNTIREDRAKGCREKIDLEFICWILYRGRTRDKVKKYNQIKQDFKDKIVVLKNPKEVTLFLKQLNI